jgi:hypothetical protein
MSSRPQPVNASRPVAHALQLFAALRSTAVRSSRYEIWSAFSVGLSASRMAAAAVTCGAANDVPAPRRKSDGPQSEYPWSVQEGFCAVMASGIVERMWSPGAEMSL